MRSVVHRGLPGRGLVWPRLRAQCPPSPGRLETDEFSALHYVSKYLTASVLRKIVIKRARILVFLGVDSIFVVLLLLLTFKLIKRV